MARTVWIVEGLGDENPKKHSVKSDETIRDLKRQFATKFGVPTNEIEVSTDTRRLTNEGARVADVVEDGDTLHIIPRAKAGR